MKLKDTPLGDPEQFNVVIEIPRGSVNKIEYDENKDKMFVDFVFKNGFNFRYNYGFIPRTYTDDGDTLDVIILTPKVLVSGSVVTCRPIAVLNQLDRGEVDDKIIAVPVDEPERSLTEEEKQQFRDFYAEVAIQKNKTIKIIGFGDKNEAMLEIKKAMI